MLLIALGLALPLAVAPQAQSHSVPCTYDTRAGAFHNGRCAFTDGIDAAGNYVETLQAGGTRVVIVSQDRQGQWARVTINGRPGTRYELNRSSYAATTDDLGVSLSWGTQ